MFVFSVAGPPNSINQWIVQELGEFNQLQIVLSQVDFIFIYFTT